MIQFDEHIFQMGWFNHQPVVESPYFRQMDPPVFGVVIGTLNHQFKLLALELPVE